MPYLVIYLKSIDEALKLVVVSQTVIFGNICLLDHVNIVIHPNSEPSVVYDISHAGHSVQ